MSQTATKQQSMSIALAFQRGKLYDPERREKTNTSFEEREREIEIKIASLICRSTAKYRQRRIEVALHKQRTDE